MSFVGHSLKTSLLAFRAWSHHTRLLRQYFSSSPSRLLPTPSPHARNTRSAHAVPVWNMFTRAVESNPPRATAPAPPAKTTQVSIEKAFGLKTSQSPQPRTLRADGVPGSAVRESSTNRRAGTKLSTALSHGSPFRDNLALPESTGGASRRTVPPAQAPKSAGALENLFFHPRVLQPDAQSFQLTPPPKCPRQPGRMQPAAGPELAKEVGLELVGDVEPPRKRRRGGNASGGPQKKTKALEREGKVLDEKALEQGRRNPAPVAAMRGSPFLIGGRLGGSTGFAKPYPLEPPSGAPPPQVS